MDTAWNPHWEVVHSDNLRREVWLKIVPNIPGDWWTGKSKMPPWMSTNYKLPKEPPTTPTIQ